MAEPTKFLVENEAISRGGGGSPFNFSYSGNIFDLPSGLLAGGGLGGGNQFLSGSQAFGDYMGGNLPTFSSPGSFLGDSLYLGGGPSLAIGGENLFGGSNLGPLERIYYGDEPGAAGSYQGGTSAFGTDTTQIGSFGSTQGFGGNVITLEPVIVTAEPSSTGFINLAPETPFGGIGGTRDLYVTGDIITLPPFQVTASPLTDDVTFATETSVYLSPSINVTNTGDIVVLTPFVVTEAPFVTTPATEITTFATSLLPTQPPTTAGGVVTMTPMVVTEGRITTTSAPITTPVNIFTIPTTGEIVTLPPFVVTEGAISTTQATTGGIVTTPYNVFTIPTTGEIVTLPPFVVTEGVISTTQATTGGVVTTPYNVFTLPTTGEIVTLPPFVVTGGRVTTPEATTTSTTAGPVTLTPFVVTEQYFTPVPTPSLFTSPITFVPTLPTVSVTFGTFPTPSVTTGPTFPVTFPPATGIPPGPTSPPSSIAGNMSTMRDFEAELGKTLGGLQKYQPQLLSMYGDIYKQFMPAGITQAEPGIISQYQQDLARLQQRQAGMLSPEDIRQAQQSAREAYGARGQVMGPGAIGAEILNREAIRQQREEQARAALQQSYGNVLNMANLQTGNIFSPIANLLGGTFNPLGAYPADVYGTNVNAALAREIAQKNYEAAIESARLSGAAQKQAGTTSLLGDIFGAALPTIISKLPFCWVAREVYGEDNPKWMQFRDWMFRHAPAWFFNFYLENGEKIAAWLKRHPWAKRPIRIWMDSRIRSMEKRELALKEAV